MSARRNQPSTVFTSHQITYTVKARGKTVTRPLIVSVKIFRMGQSSHVQDRGAAAALHVIFRPIVVHVVSNDERDCGRSEWGVLDWNRPAGTAYVGRKRRCCLGVATVLFS